MSRQLGQPFMPWQEYVALIGCELLEDGRPAYKEIIISVPRQNGKTTLVLAWELDRAVSWGRPQRIIYSAQTGRDASEKLIEDQLPLVQGSPFKVAVSKPVLVNGKEAIVFRNRSRISVIGSGEHAGHGKTVGLGVIDEAFKGEDNRREQALRPAMRTVRDSQLLICSTMGTDSSTYFNKKVETGRTLAMQDRDDARVAYFEWSAPEDSDISDPRVWAACTPAWNITVFEDDVRAEYESNLATPGEFKRFALNQRTASEERVIPDDVWNLVQGDVKPEGRLVLAVECTPERSAGAIAVADEQGRVELIDHQIGSGSLAPKVIEGVSELSKLWSVPVAVDPGGPAGAFIPDLERAGVKVIKVAGRDVAQACGQFFDAVADGKIQIRRHPKLDEAVAGAKKRASGDAWVWDRKDVTNDVSPLMAATLAFRAAGGAIDVSANVW